MNFPSPLRGCVAPLLVATLLTTGCLSSRYQQVREPTPVMPLTISATEPAFAAKVEAVIIFRGPGSWKKNAYWDEYVVALTNSGGVPATVTSCRLVGQGTFTAEAGTDPWQLERESRTLADRNFGFAKNTVVQVGGGTGAMVLGGTVGGLLSVGGGGAYVSATALGAAVGMLVAIPVYVGGSAYRNITHRGAITTEFNRRRLPLPLVLSPTETRHGSLFFPITPSPRQLVVQWTTGASSGEVVVDLASLQSLHLRAATASTPTRNVGLDDRRCPRLSAYPDDVSRFSSVASEISLP
jgi:hypothetical protein